MKRIEVVAAVIVDNGRVLATQRGYGDYDGYWEFPGGKVEPDESREEALAREIREELDMELEHMSFICTVEYDYPSFHIVMHCFACSPSSGCPVLKEHRAGRWLSPSELHTVKWLPADYDALPLVEEYLITCK